MSGTNDTNAVSYFGNMGLELSDLEFPDPEEFDDLLKLSQCVSTRISNTTFPGGSREDDLDVVSGLDLNVSNCSFRGRVTIKGAFYGWHFVGCSLRGVVEIGQFDNYWYPGRPPTRRGGIISCTGGPYRKPVRVWLWDAEKPEVSNTEVEFTIVPKWIWYPYFLTQYAWVRLLGKRTKLLPI